MEQFLWLIPLGFVIGAFGTLIGVGGGFILIPLLLLMYPHENPELITSISLGVVFFNAASGTAAYARMRRINYRAGIIFAAAAVPGAILGALSTAFIPRRAFDAIFGVLLMCAATYLALRPMGAKIAKQNTGDSVPGHSYNMRLGAGISVVVGYFSSLLGLGGGIFHVPALVRILKFPVHTATATSHFILAIMALTGTLTHVFAGTLRHGAHRMIALSIGVVIGAQVGAALSRRVSGSWIIRGLAAALAIVGIRILLIAFS